MAVGRAPQRFNLPATRMSVRLHRQLPTARVCRQSTVRRQPTTKHRLLTSRHHHSTKHRQPTTTTYISRRLAASSRLHCRLNLRHIFIVLRCVVLMIRHWSVISGRRLRRLIQWRRPAGGRRFRRLSRGKGLLQKRPIVCCAILFSIATTILACFHRRTVSGRRFRTLFRR